MSIFFRNNIYLDSASGRILEKSVIRAMDSILKKKIANPSSGHYFGILAKNILENSRKYIATTINAHSDEIIFTGSGTESVSLAIIGTVYEARKKITKPHIVTSNIEHSSVINTCRMLESMDLAEVSYIKPDQTNGLINPNDIFNAIKENTVLVSIHMVNSEIGIIQNIPDIIKKIDKIKEEKYKITKMRFSSGAYYPYVHIDACQAYAHLDLIPITKSGVDMITFNSVKIGGPSGIAVLYKKRKVLLSPIYNGGDQEYGLRPGTQSPFLAYGFKKACEILVKDRLKNEKKYKELKDYFLKELNNLSQKENFPFYENSSEFSIPSIVSISFPYFTGQQFAIELDMRGIAVSSKSACNTIDDTESYVIKEIRKDSGLGTIRISFSPDTKKSHINKLLKEIKSIVQTYRTVLY